MGGRIVTDRSGGVTSLFSQSKEDVDARSDRAGGRGLRSEVRDSLPSEGVLLVVQGDDDLGRVLELLNGVIGREESVSGEEHEFQEGKELDGPTVAGALGVPTGAQAEVESQYYQVGNVSGFMIGGGGCCSHDGVDDAQPGGIFSFNWGVFNPICFEFPGKALDQSNASLGVRGLLRVRESHQEVGRQNHPPCLRNRLLPKSVHSALRVMGVTDSVPVDLEDLDVRDGWILESRIDRQGGAEVVPLLVDLMLSRILSCPLARIPVQCGDHTRKKIQRREGDLPQTVRLRVCGRHVNKE